MEVGAEAVPDLGVATDFVVEDVCAGGFLIGVLFAAEAGPPDLFGAASFFGAETVLAGLFDGGASFFGVAAVDEAVSPSLEGPVGLELGFCTGCFIIGVAGFLPAAAGFGVLVALDAAVVEEEVCFMAGFEGVAVAGLTCFAAIGGADDMLDVFFAAVSPVPSVVEVCTFAGPVAAAGFFAVAASRADLADGLFTVVGGGAAMPLVATDPFVDVERVDATAVEALLDIVTTVP